MAKIIAKTFMASVLGFFELFICEGCKNLIFGAGKAEGIIKVERPIFCPQCGKKLDIRHGSLSEKEIIAYTET